MRCRGFNVHLLVEASPRQLREASGIVRVGLVCFHRLETLMCLVGIDAHDRHAELAQAEAGQLCQSAFNRDPLSARKRDPVSVA